MAVRARFYVAEVTRYANQVQEGYAAPAPRGMVVMRPVTRGEDNKEWASATPSGEVRMTVTGPAWPWFDERLGKEVSILIEGATG